MAHLNEDPSKLRVVLTQADQDGCRAAMDRWPTLAGRPEPHEIWLARHGSDGPVCGAVLLDLYPVPYSRPGRPILIACDGPDGGDAALRGAIADAMLAVIGSRGGKGLFAYDSVAQGSAEWHAWRALDFEPCPKLSHYEVELRAYLDSLTPLYDSLTIHGRVPDNASVIALADAPLGEVIQYQMEFIGGDAGRLEMRLRGGGHYPFDDDMSRVAMVDGRVCGFLLVRMDRFGRAIVESRVVVPSQRGRWVNVAIMQEAAERAARRGVTHIRFLGAERHTDTHRLAARAGVSMHRRDVMYRLVTGAVSEPEPD